MPVAVIALVLIVGGVAAFLRINRNKAELLTDPIEKGSIIESVYGIGTVTATRSFQLKSGVTSSINRIFAEEGHFVKRGDPLVDIEGTPVFRAPFDGTITSMPFKVGENVFAQTVVLSLVDLSDRYVLVSLEQQGAIRVRHGQKAKLSFEGMRNESYEGLVESVYSHESTFLVRINTPRLPSQILPGMAADVAIGVDERNGVLIAPVAAIVGGVAHVKHGGGKPITVAVKTGIVDGSMAEIVSGDLRPGDRLVIPQKVVQ